jgi:hypothetical protein
VRDFQGTTIADEALPEDVEHLRWFPLPAEILAELQGAAPVPRRDNPLHLSR